METIQTNETKETGVDTLREPADAADCERMFRGLRELARRRDIPAAYRKRFYAALRGLKKAVATGNRAAFLAAAETFHADAQTIACEVKKRRG